MPFEEAQRAFVCRNLESRQRLEKFDDLCALPDASDSNLADHERMTDDSAVVQSILQIAIRFAEMVDPDGRVDEGHSNDRRRRGARAFLSDPPIEARRAALR